MTSISSLYSYLSGSMSSTNKLSSQTTKKLLALGIDVSSVSNETEAKKRIEEEENKKSENVSSETKQTSVSAEESLYNSIKNLSRKLGITINEQENIEKIFDKISEKLEGLKENSYNSNLNVFISEYDILKRQFKNLYSGDSSILSAMDMISKVNRAELGI